MKSVDEKDVKLSIKNKIIEKIQKNAEEFRENEADNSVDLVKSDPLGLNELIKANKILEIKYNETFESLTKVREIVLQLSEQILDKEFRVTQLEKKLHESEKKIKSQRDDLRIYEEKFKEIWTKTKDEKEILESQIKRLCEIIKGKDSEILLISTENSRLTMELRDSKKKNKELLGQLDLTCDNLSLIIKETNEREKMLNTLESELKRKQVERQGLYLNEINRNKKLYINIKVKENMMSQIIKDKNNQIAALSSEVKVLREKLDRISTTFSEVSSSTTKQNKTLAITNDKIQCTVSSPCNMKMVNGTAKIII
ncbi:hypothetical protein TpMuguga_02g00491 [Theileria parva strain Muguga]|uniref:Uncharacterized protein n=1 Tax=Theileria parva TaxID=5875 RepID=Q4N4Z9_THEPA|nr:uncharacterized protein TpMuguga_02g00491 [Theileria parva strain Muguga]EAN32774.1 hypothetical protein TpMuguga_02g00491 [Theileria parva strain Muguga]|eukprot:XP_765057.1 hypothetical protein [Theileria parva strain Muguga]